MINISDQAASRIKELLDAEETPDLFLRLGVRPGGCSGFSYAMGFDDEEKSGDRVLTVSGLKVVVEEDSMRYLDGVEIDFKSEGMSGGFTIDNPNAAASCGCGSSFRMKDEEGVVEKCDD
ncbi:MAG: iron-sulfur cluster assembly accessory protein [Paenibacillaceae bacterium]|nr:iron-sulfur cluster assembly accessory protein [Paenibacillaceae bacterium]